MGVSSFIHNGIATLGKAYDAGVSAIDREGLTVLQFFGRALKDSSQGAYYVFLKAEIDGILKKSEIDNVINETSNQVVYLLGGYYLNPSTLLGIKQKLEDEGVSVQIINKRYYSRKSIISMVLELKKRMKENEEKEVVLFGYSAGGMVAHRIGEQSGYKSVSYGLSKNPEKTMVGTLVSLSKKEGMKEVKIPKNGTNIIESFSAMVPNDSVEDNKTVRLKEVYSHMSIGSEHVVDEIVKEILGKMQKDVS